MASVFHTWTGYVPSPAFTTDGLVGHWDAGNSASYPGSGTDWFDLTANSNDGVLTNGPTYSASGGAHIELDGDNDYIDFGSIVAANPLSMGGATGFTVEMWLYWDGSGDSFQRILSKSTNNSGANGYMVYINTSTDGLVTNVNGAGISSGASIMQIGQWAQYVYTNKDGVGSAYYLNGIQNGAVALPQPNNPPSATAPMAFGTWTSSYSGREFNGRIGCVRIYNKELSSAEITLNYDQLKGRYGLS